jgi:hypothetical protein
VLAVAVPGVAPLVADRARDLFSDEVLSARGESYPELVAGQYWATDAVLGQPASSRVLDEVRQHTHAQLGTSGQQVTLESHRSGRIDLETITAVVEERRKPLGGTAFVADPQGSEETALVEFRLDSGAAPKSRPWFRGTAALRGPTSPTARSGSSNRASRSTW